MASAKEVHLRALSTFGLPLPLGHTSRSSSHWKPQGNASPPSGMGPWVPRECWHRSYARNPLFALPSLLQGGRAFRDPLLGSAGTAGSLFSSRCSQEWSRGSSAGANFRPPNIADVPLSSYLCAVLPCKSPVYQGVKVLQGHSVLGIRKNFEFLTYLKCLGQILSLSDVGVTLLFFFSASCQAPFGPCFVGAHALRACKPSASQPLPAKNLASLLFTAAGSCHLGWMHPAPSAVFREGFGCGNAQRPVRAGL